MVNDLDDQFVVWSEGQDPVTANEDLSIICGASAHKYATELNWHKDGVLVENSSGEFLFFIWLF